MDNIFFVKRKVGEQYVTCRGTVIGRVKRRKAKRFKKPGRVKVIKTCGG